MCDSSALLRFSCCGKRMVDSGVMGGVAMLCGGALQPKCSATLANVQWGYCH